MRRGLGALGRRAQLLDQLLAPSRPVDADRDLGADGVAREPDHALGEVADVDRLAHLEHEHLAALDEHRRLQHELHRLVHAHEEPRHAGVRDGDRTTGRDLARERRDDAAAAPEHVAEPHRAEPGALGRTGEDDLLARPLRRAHHARGPHRLVGRDEHEPLDVDGDRGVDHVAGADDVRGDGLARVVLEQGHVLVRRGVEHDVGPVPAEHVEDHVAVADVGEHLHRRRVEPSRGVVEVGLVVVEQHEPCGLELRDLTGDLAADRAGPR